MNASPLRHALRHVNFAVLPQKFHFNYDPDDKLTQGRRSTVILTNSLGQELLRRSFDQYEEFQFFAENYLSSFKGYSFFSAAFIPVRTDSVNELAKSVSFPTLINHFPEQNSCPQKTLGLIAGISFDLLTLIPRVVATPFRMYYNYNTQVVVHPLVELFKDNPELVNSLKNETITVQTEIEKVILEEGEELQPSEHGNKTVKGSRCIERSIKKIIVNFHGHRPICESRSATIDHWSFRGILNEGGIFVYNCNHYSESSRSKTF